eukprot:scaffold232684_cov20-Tisochrysis_lutea.AAC.2
MPLRPKTDTKPLHSNYQTGTYIPQGLFCSVNRATCKSLATPLESYKSGQTKNHCVQRTGLASTSRIVCPALISEAYHMMAKVVQWQTMTTLLSRFS